MQHIQTELQPTNLLSLAMLSSELVQILVPAFIGAASAYLINQLPPLRAFRGSKFLLIALVIELSLLGGIWVWLSGEAAKTSSVKGLVEDIGFGVLGAFILNLLQTILSIWRSGNSLQPTPPQLSSNPKTVVKKTRMIGKKQKARVTKSDAWVEDTVMRGEDQEFTVTDDSNPPPSSPPNNNPNP
ncbi:MAG: hypothetical protein QNJ63_25145 [Calothrix sp. MO_192.B10]|nr:hypothetical protein [Calothrix sp. MO_192.B10]